MINRLILWLSLAGMVLALHLWVQKARGFDQGCLGLTKPAAVAPAERGGCEEVGALPSSHLLGVSNAAWGYAFYFALALVSFAKIFMVPPWARRLHAAGEITVVVALIYSGYLVYTMAFVAHAWCVLCTLSAVVVAALAVLHGALRWRGGFAPVPESARLVELAAAGGGLFVATGVLVGVLLFVDRLGTRPLDQGKTRGEVEDIVGTALPKFIDAAKLREMRPCRFDDDGRVVPWRDFLSEGTPFVGKAGGPTVIVFYDPNCGHCAAYHPIFVRAMERFKDRARFTIRPRVLWDASVLQVAALQLAEGSGKYFELWQAMFDRPKDGSGNGASVEQIAAIFRRLGLDASDLAARLEAVRPQVLAAREQAKRADIGGVPAIYIEGRRVWSPNRGEDCLGKLIEKVGGSVSPPTGAR
ncbi:MAG: vitamin K epoxide reductase family protein [Candidatus Didemnitutus sp.]|nr:vitamin K epoxide reductase family protein [Candidatus Didemnitutus sp.]